MLPPPPWLDPTHWLTVALVTGLALGVSALMLLVILTVQVIGCAASLSEPLHWFTEVTRSVEWLTKVPLPGAHGSRPQSRVTVVTEPSVPPLIVLTTVTVQVIRVVAPRGPGPMLLHWLTVLVAATADGGAARLSTNRVLTSTVRAITACRQVRRRCTTRTAVVGVGMDHGFRKATVWRPAETDNLTQP